MPGTSSAPAVATSSHFGARVFLGTVGTSALIQTCTLVQGVLMAHFLGPEGRGHFAALILWPAVLAGLGHMGVNQALAKRAARTAQPRYLTWTMLASCAFTSLPAMALGAALVHRQFSSAPGLLWLAYLCLLLIPGLQLSANAQAIEQGLANFSRLNWLRALPNPISLAGIIAVCLLRPNNVGWFVSAYLLAIIGTAVYSFVTGTYIHGLCADRQQLKETFRDGLPYWASTASDMLYWRTDQMLVAWLFAAADLGFYVVAGVAASAFNLLATSAGTIVFTMAARSPARGISPEEAFVFRQLALFSILAALLLIAGMPLLLPIVYGRPFLPAVPIAQVMIPGAALSGLASILDQSLRGRSRTTIGIAGRTISILAIAVLGCAVSRQIGLVGFAFAYTCAQMLYLAAMVYGVLRVQTQSGTVRLCPTLADARTLAARAMFFVRSHCRPFSS